MLMHKDRKGEVLEYKDSTTINSRTFDFECECYKGLGNAFAYKGGRIKYFALVEDGECLALYNTGWCILLHENDISAQCALDYFVKKYNGERIPRNQNNRSPYTKMRDL